MASSVLPDGHPAAYSAAHSGVFSYSVCSADECALIVHELDRCADLWYPQDSGRFFTFGFPAYQLDNPAHDYWILASRDNPRLWSRFEWLYRRVLQLLEVHLGERVSFYDSLAIPGFHIFPVGPLGEIAEGGKHTDLSFLQVPWPDDTHLDSASHLSYTLALEVPSSGAGLDLWYGGPNAPPSEEASSLLDDSDGSCAHYPYTEGSFVLFSGNRLHRIAGSTGARVGERRVTLQGHCLRVDGHWITYW